MTSHVCLMTRSVMVTLTVVTALTRTTVWRVGPIMGFILVLRLGHDLGITVGGV